MYTKAYNLMQLMPQAAIIIDVESLNVIAANSKSKENFGIDIGATSSDIAAIIDSSTPISPLADSVKVSLSKNENCVLNHLSINAIGAEFEHYDLHISFVDDTKKQVYLIFSQSAHEIKLMSQQKDYYDTISSASYSYPFHLDVRKKQMQLFDPELIKFNLPLLMENYPKPVLDSGVLCKEDEARYLKVVDKMYKGEPPKGCFRCYDPKGELLTYTVNYVVNRDEFGAPVEVTGDFVIESETGLKALKDTYENLDAKPQEKVVLAHQIKAHFFFNTLNTISALCKQDAIKADNAIRTFATYMRSYMYLISEDENISFEQELKLVKSTLEIEKLRFPDRFTYELDLEEVDFEIPPLTIQPIVENALLHGLRRTGRHGNLKISSYKKDDKMYVEISDNGLGFDKSVLVYTKSIGLRNLIRRIRLMVNGTVIIDTEIGEGTKVTIEIPIEKE